MTASYKTGSATLDQALAVDQVDETKWTGRVMEGYDVFGIPHGGYLAALAGSAVLNATGTPDLLTITTHFHRKATMGPIELAVRPLGASRRIKSVMVEAAQEGRAVLSAFAAVGDRTDFSGPQWTSEPAFTDDMVELGDVATAGFPPSPPNIAERMRLRFDHRTALFARDEKSEVEARFHMQMDLDHPDQLAALIACDVTPPAVWNVLGRQGWVPTVELTAHVRGRPAPGPLKATVSTSQVSGGFLEEDALIYDSAGTLIVQSRQLACWTGA